MNAKVSGNKVVIELDVDTLVSAFNYKEDNQDIYRVKYRKKFAQGICDYLKNYSHSSESGLSALQELLDEIFDEMVCDGADYIKVLQDEE
jgi:hypothetical protein